MIRFTKHAQEAIRIRDIAIEWIEAAVTAPDRIEPDPHHPDRTRPDALDPRIAGQKLVAIAARGRVTPDGNLVSERVRQR